MAAGGLLYIIGIVVLLVLAVLWFFLPFAVFGMKDRLDALILEAKDTNKLLREIRDAQRQGKP